MTPYYIMTDRFDQSRGEAWKSYVSWSGLDQLSEVVSLDSTLCPTVQREILEADWPHIVNQDYLIDYFTDLDYLVKRFSHINYRNLLCVFRNPKDHPTILTKNVNFKYEGCDLIEINGGISALTNCGGFPLAFSNEELLTNGLLFSFERAKEVQNLLLHHYPNEAHAQCDVWSIFRATDDFVQIPSNHNS